MSNTLKLTFELTAGLVNNTGPTIDVLLNDKVIISNKVLPQSLMLDIVVDNSCDNRVCIVHKNKNDSDTQMVDGVIVADKFVKVVGCWADDIVLPDSMLYGICTPIYFENFLSSINYEPPDTYTDNALYFNGTLEYAVPANFFEHLSNKIRDSDFVWLKQMIDTGDLPDNDYDVKYLGYAQDTSSEDLILSILEDHGYHVDR